MRLWSGTSSHTGPGRPVVETLAVMEPLWEPGTRHGYHALVVGHLVGEVLRRVTGCSLGTSSRTEVAEPLGLDFWIGLPEEQVRRAARQIQGTAERVDAARAGAPRAAVIGAHKRRGPAHAGRAHAAAHRVPIRGER